MFISSYLAIYFFVKNFFVYISVNTICKCSKWMTPNKCCGIFFVHWFGLKNFFLFIFQWIRYSNVRSGWPQTNVVEYFLCIGSAKYTRALPPARNMSLFSSIIIKILSYGIIRISFPSCIFGSPQKKKQALNFLKRNSDTNVCLKFFVTQNW